MRIVNNQMLTSLHNRRVVSKPVTFTGRGKVDVIHLECNKPLQSKFYVDGNCKAKFKPYYHDSMKHQYRCISFGNTDYEVDRKETEWHDVGSREILAEQQKLYNKLKRQHERELKAQRGEVDNTPMGKEEKQEIKTRKISKQLLAGLHGHPNYNRVYGVV